MKIYIRSSKQDYRDCKYMLISKNPSENTVRWYTDDIFPEDGVHITAYSSDGFETVLNIENYKIIRNR